LSRASFFTKNLKTTTAETLQVTGKIYDLTPGKKDSGKQIGVFQQNVDVADEQQRLTIVGAVQNMSGGDFVFGTVDYYNTLAIKWTVAIKTGANFGTPMDIRQTQHQVFVRYGLADTTDPNRKNLRLSVVAIGCQAASGKKSPEDILKAIEARFATLDITAFYDAASGKKGDDFESKPIFYYRSWLTPPAVVKTENPTAWLQLLDKKNPDGQCTHWSQFFLQCLAQQGLLTAANVAKIGNPRIVAFQSKEASEQGISGGILIGTWEFRGMGSSGDQKHPFKNTVISLTIKNQYSFTGDSEVTYKTPRAGQNNPTPPGLFGNHVVIQFDNEFFDPSYGRTYKDVEDFRTSVVTGFFTIPNMTQLFFRKGTNKGDIEVVAANNLQPKYN
jgi:hypothetical protein